MIPSQVPLQARSKVVIASPVSDHAAQAEPDAAGQGGEEEQEGDEQGIPLDERYGEKQARDQVEEPARHAERDQDRAELAAFLSLLGGVLGELVAEDEESGTSQECRRGDGLSERMALGAQVERHPGQD